jgi:AcrR family transcriptional regulator
VELASPGEAAHKSPMRSETAQRGGRARLAPEVRRGQILDAAEVLLIAHGGLPLPLEDLARAAQVSKALIYAYFPNQHDLANALLARQIAALLAAGLEDAVGRADLFDAAQASAGLYFEEVARAGPVAHIVLRDPFMAGRIDPTLAAIRDRMARRLARAGRATLRLSPKEAVAALSLMTTIPEEAGRLVHAGDLSLERGRELTARLIGSSLRALTPDG